MNKEPTEHVNQNTRERNTVIPIVNYDIMKPLEILIALLQNTLHSKRKQIIW